MFERGDPDLLDPVDHRVQFAILGQDSHCDTKLVAPRMSFLDPNLVASGARRSVLLCLLPRLIARELFPLTSVFGEESLNKSGVGRSALNFGGKSVSTYLNGEERVFGQRLEELSQNKVDQIDEVLVRLFPRQRFLLGKNSLE